MFTYDPFQKEAIEAIDQNQSVLISAPTGAGKTCIAEYAIEKAMSEGKNVIYTAPVKALSNQKYRDFREKYGNDQVGIVTGDVSLNSQAPLQIMTTEIYRNKLFENIEKLDNVSCLIFDEVHYIDDRDRGTVWEEAIMFSPHHIRFICLSATIPNVTELADWMQTVHHCNIKVIIENNRPVPLKHAFQSQGKILDSFKSLKKIGYLDKADWSQFRVRNWMQHSRKHRQKWIQAQKYVAKPNSITDLIEHIQSHDGLPCIYFVFARKRTELLANELTRYCFLKPEEVKEIVVLFDNLCEQYEIQDEPSIQNLKTLVKHGIAYHHAGMLPTVKEVVERLFTSKLLKLIFTTETFAIGINMPAKTVVFDELRKYHGTHFGNLKTRDYFQMAGRAGRRGMDEVGYVYSRINPKDTNYYDVVQMISGKPEVVQSQFNATYATLLNLYRSYGERLMDIYPKSFHYFQASKNLRKKATKSIYKKIDLLKTMGYIHDGNLTEKGEFASCMYGYELPLAEMFAEGFLDNLSAIELNIVLVALIYEPRRRQEAPRYKKDIWSLMKRVDYFTDRVNETEDHFRIFPLTKQAFFHLGPAIQAWSKGIAFSELWDYTDVDEGEIVRNIRMVIQLLRIIREAPNTPKPTRRKAQEAIQLIDRDAVDAEKQLRV